MPHTDENSGSEESCENISATDARSLRLAIDARWKQCVIGALESAEGRVPTDAEIVQHGQVVFTRDQSEKALFWKGRELANLKISQGEDGLQVEITRYV